MGRRLYTDRDAQWLPLLPGSEGHLRPAGQDIPRGGDTLRGDLARGVPAAKLPATQALLLQASLPGQGLAQAAPPQLRRAPRQHDAAAQSEQESLGRAGPQTQILQ